MRELELLKVCLFDTEKPWYVSLFFVILCIASIYETTMFIHACLTDRSVFAVLFHFMMVCFYAIIWRDIFDKVETLIEQYQEEDFENE